MKIFILGIIIAWMMIVFVIVSALIFGKMLCAFIQKAKKYVSILVFLLSAIGLTFFYSLVAMSTSSNLLNAIFCAIFLVLSWMAENALYKRIADGEEIMNLADKNVSNFLALVCMAGSGVVCGVKLENVEYVILFSMAISVFVGEYISVEDIYSNKSFAIVLSNTKSKFRHAHKSVWIIGIIINILFLVLLIFDEIANKLNYYIDKFGQGLAVGILSALLIFILVMVCVEKRKVRNSK